MRQILIVALSALFMCSCSLYQKYTRPEEVKTDNLYGEAVALSDTTSIADIGWRDFFADKHLQALIEQGLKNNADMRIASQRIIASEATLRTARLAFYPSVSFEPTFSTKNYINHSSQQSYSIPVAASWEIDIAGRLLNSKRRSESAYEQSKLYRRSVQTNLIASIANAYYTLLMLDAQLEISETTAANWKENVRIMRAMKQAGMTNEASVSQTEANSCSIDASLFDMRYKITEVENALALLLGTVPQHFTRGKLAEQSLNKTLSVGIPAQLLARRPDVQSAERSLEQAYYATNIARGQLYPSLKLTGNGGWQETLGRAVTTPAAWLINFTAGLVTDIFKAGQKRANIKIAKAQFEESLIKFQQVLLQAGSEVNEALAQCQAARSKTDIRKRQIAALESAVVSTRQLMSHSESTYLEVLTAQQTLLSAQLSQVADYFEEIQGTINLYHALGGGTDEDAVSPAPRTKREIRAEKRAAKREAKANAKLQKEGAK